MQEQIHSLQSVLKAITDLKDEVLNIKEVDFNKYADIILLFKSGFNEYWIWKLFDTTLSNHIMERFGNKPDLGKEIFNTYQEILKEALKLKNDNIRPTDDRSISLAGRWWDMIMKFTGGNMNLISNLKKFNENKNEWNNEFAEKQQAIDDFIGESLVCYFEKNNMSLNDLKEMEDK